jgi:uncharacterized protein (TIGR03066 family)
MLGNNQVLQNIPIGHIIPNKNIPRGGFAMKRKFYVVLLILAMMVSAFALTGCGGDDEDLVGRWEYRFDNGDRLEWNLNSNGAITITTERSGQRENITGTWSSSGNRLTMRAEGDSETLTYSISGNRLTISGDGETAVMTRVN